MPPNEHFKQNYNFIPSLVHPSLERCIHATRPTCHSFGSWINLNPTQITSMRRAQPVVRRRRTSRSSIKLNDLENPHIVVVFFVASCSSIKLHDLEKPHIVVVFVVSVILVDFHVFAVFTVFIVFCCFLCLL